MKTPLPMKLSPLFWDVDFASVDATQHRAFVLDRLLEYGGIEAVRWAEQFYGLEGIKEYFQRRGVRVLSAKTRAFWAAVLGLTDESCTTKSLARSKDPLWQF
jgi:hypothetical protein